MVGTSGSSSSRSVMWHRKRRVQPRMNSLGDVRSLRSALLQCRPTAFKGYKGEHPPGDQGWLWWQRHRDAVRHTYHTRIISGSSWPRASYFCTTSQ